MVIGASSVQYAARVHSRALIIPRADGNAGFQKSMRDDLLPVAGYCSDRSAGAYKRRFPGILDYDKQLPSEGRTS